jgi:hypothetical protein
MLMLELNQQWYYNYMYNNKKTILFQKSNYVYWYLIVFNLHVTFKVMEICTPLGAATLTVLQVNTCPLWNHSIQPLLEL